MTSRLLGSDYIGLLPFECNLVLIIEPKVTETEKVLNGLIKALKKD